MLPTPKIWGRDAETQYLLKRVAGASSATLVRGDPQIGKSTLIRAFITKLRGADANSRIGMYKAVATPHDPFTFVVADLLKDVYQWSHLSDQTAIIAAGLKRNFTMSKLKEVSFALWKTISALPGVPPIDPLVQWLKTEMEGLDLSVATTRLSTHEVTSILKTLLEACHGLRLVLIIDDYSAAYEGRPAGAAPAWDHATLLHLLSERLPNTHIVIAWKDSATSVDALHQITQSFLEHSGNVLRVLPLNSQETLAWAHAELPELVSRVGELSMLQLAEGLPKVLSEFRVSSVQDGTSASTIAEQIKRGSYEFLHRYLESCPPDQRALLMQMAANELPTPTYELATMLGISNDEVVHYSKLARARQLLLDVSTDLFVFEHDVKRRVVADHLHRYHSIWPFFERALGYHERQLNGHWPHSPAAVFHLFGACRAAHALAHDESHAALEEFYSLYLLWMAKPRNSDLIPVLAKHSSRTGRPIPIQATLLTEALVQANPLLAPDSDSDTGPPESTSVPEDWLTWFTGALSDLPASLEARLFLVNAAKFATAHAAIHQDEVALAVLDPLLDRVLVDEAEDAKVVSEAAIALANTTFALCAGRRTVLARLKTVGECRRWELDLKRTYSRALVNLIQAHDSDEEWVRVCVKELLLIADHDDLPEDTAEACLRGLHDAAVSLDLWGRRDAIPELVAKSTTIASRYRRFPSVVACQAKILYNATAYFGRLGDSDAVVRTFESLRQLVAENATIELWPELTAACANLMVIALETADGELTRRAETFANALPAASLQLAEVRESYAVIQSSAAIAHRKIGEQGLMRQALDKLETRAYGPLDARFAKLYASALWRVISNLEEAQTPSYDYSSELELFHRLSRLAKVYMDDRDVVAECAIGISNFANLAGIQRDWTSLRQAMQRLQEGLRSFSEDAEIASHVGRGHAVGWFASYVADERDLATECESACEQLGGPAFEVMVSFQQRVRDMNRLGEIS